VLGDRGILDTLFFAGIRIEERRFIMDEAQKWEGLAGHYMVVAIISIFANIFLVIALLNRAGC
jgi:hypothetical protein